MFVLSTVALLMETALVVKMTAYYVAAFCFILFAVSNGKVIDDLLQDDEFDSPYLGVSLPPPKCNDWSDWINSNQPANGTDEEEMLDQHQLDYICPPKLGGIITQLKCADEKGEPLQNVVNRTSADKNYVVNCDAPKDGVTCHILITGRSCPDFSISFMCTCPTIAVPLVTTSGSSSPITSANRTKPAVLTSTKTSSTKPSATSTKLMTFSTTLSSTSVMTKTDSTTSLITQFSTTNANKQTTSSKGHSGSNSQQKGGDSNNNNYTIGKSNVPWWLIPVLVAAFLFIINIILAVCLRKKIRKQTDQTVHPM